MKLKLSREYITLSYLLLMFTSCTKEIQLDIPKTEPKLVVQASIENGLPPFVILTKSVNYFDSTSLETFEKTIVLNAEVTISDGSRTLKLDTISSDTITGTRLEKLAEYLSIPVENLRRVKYSIYSFKSFSNFMIGEVGKTYTLTVKLDGKTYSATTTINPPVSLDSMWFREEYGKTGLGYINVKFTEPLGLGNCYRWSAKRLTKDSYFISPIGTSFQDKLIDGKTFEFYANRGSPQNSDKPEDKNEERGYFRKDDTVIVKFNSIDFPVFNFYRTYDVEIANRGNPFAAPITVQTNFNNGALGVFAGYGSWVDTVYLGRK